MVSACIIGISGFGRVHYADLVGQAESGEMEIVAATVINQEEEPVKCTRLKELGAVLFTDHREMLRAFGDKADVCFIPTGIPLHCPMSQDAMRAGCNVFVEKPVAATVQDVDAMRACERETGRFVAVGYQHIYDPVVMKIKELLLGGELGRVICIKSMNLSKRLDTYYARNAWAGRVKLGDAWVLDGPFNNAHAHQVNLMCFWAGKEQRESAEIESVQAELYKARDIETADTACIRARTAGGSVVLYFGSHSCSSSQGSAIEIRCESGVVTWTDKVTKVSRSHGSSEELPMLPGGELRKEMMRCLRERLAGRESFVSTLSTARAETVCANGAFESSPIRTIGQEHAVTAAEQGGEMIAIRDMEEVMLKAFDKEALFSEIDVPWAVEGERVSMIGYERFRGGRTGKGDSSK